MADFCSERCRVERIKLNPDDHGGFQTKRLSREEAKERFCARRWCSDKGRVQIEIPFENPRMYQILCARHFIMMMIVSAAAMGDPSPLGEGQRIAEALGVDWDPPSLGSPQLVDPEQFCCSRCGGRMMSETMGIYKGVRWIHTCVPTGEETEGGN